MKLNKNIRQKHQRICVIDPRIVEIEDGIISLLVHVGDGMPREEREMKTLEILLNITSKDTYPIVRKANEGAALKSYLIAIVAVIHNKDIFDEIERGVVDQAALMSLFCKHDITCFIE